MFIARKYNTFTMPNIDSALSNIIKFGTPLQGKIAADMRRSNIRYSFQTTSSEAETFVTDSNKTQQRINSVTMNELQALDELTIGFDPRGDAMKSDAALERCLVHEGRHAYHCARMISEFSQAHRTKKTPYNPDHFTVEFAAYQAYADYVIQANRLNHPQKQLFINHSIEWGVTKWAGKKLVADVAGIYKFIADKYKMDGKTNFGRKLSEIFLLTPRSS